MFWIPVLGALALGSCTVLERFILSKKNADPRFYQTLLFLAVVLIMAPFIYFFWKLDSGAFEFWNILIFVGVIVFSVLANLFAFYAMKWEKIDNLEPAKVLEPLFVVLLAIIFSFVFGDELFERNTRIIIPALIAVGALIFSHVRKHHLTMNKYFLAAIVGSFFYALELVLSRLILDFYTPISFYFLRAVFIFLITFVVFRPKIWGIRGKQGIQVLIVGALWVIYRLAIYYGYLHLGVISTTLVVMLGPIFVYIFAYKFLHEKIHWRNVVAAIIIIACIVYTIFA